MVIQRVPSVMIDLMKRVQDESTKRYLQNQFLSTCSQLSKAILNDMYVIKVLFSKLQSQYHQSPFYQ